MENEDEIIVDNEEKDADNVVVASDEDKRQEPSLDDFWSDDDDGADDADGASNEESSLEEELAQELVKAFESYDIAEDIIPEDFDVSDSRQLKKLLVTTQRNVMQQSVQTALKAVVPSLQLMHDDIMEKVQQEIGASLQQQTVESKLAKELPIVNDSKIGPMAKSVFDQAMKKTNGNFGKAVTLTRKMLDDAGISNARRVKTERKQTGNLVKFLGEA